MRWKVYLLGIVLTGLVAAVGVTTARASMSGADFLQAAPAYQDGFVSGFVRGMYLACLDHLEATKDVCSIAPLLDATFEMTPPEVLDLFLNYIRKNPALQQKEATELLVDCLKESAAKPANVK
jgi:hypothetical protein